MKNRKIISFLVVIIIILGVAATSAGIFTRSGEGSYDYRSIRGNDITIYGQGLYRHMSAGVAVQGIAQDYVTLFLAVPLLLLSFLKARGGSIRWRFVLAGILNYFLVTYFMYLEMAMYNAMFLAYVALLGSSFFALALVLFSFETGALPAVFTQDTPVKFAGGFLIFNSIIIALLWLSVVIPPLIDGSVIPESVEHYTTLTVQGLDLALFLPISFISGLLFIRRLPMGYLMAPVTLVFLSFLMTALVAKIIAMAQAGAGVFPAVIIIPLILFVSLICMTIVLRKIKLH